jgi:hypothetical protein
MMKNGGLAVIVLSVVLMTGWGVGTAQAAIYQDVYTITIEEIIDEDPVPTNPWGLSVGDSFDMMLTFDSSTIDAVLGGFVVDGVTNFLTISVPGGFTFIETDDSSDPIDVYGYMLPAPFDPSASYLDAFYYDGIQGDITGGANLYIGAERTSGSDGGYLSIRNDDGYVEYALSVDFNGFDPATDRTAVPIPGTLLLIAPGLLSMLAIRRRNVQ